MGKSPVDPSARSAEAGLPVDQGPRRASCYRAGSCESITAALRRACRQRDAAAPKATAMLPKIKRARDWLLAQAADDARRLKTLGPQGSGRTAQVEPDHAG